MESCTNCCKQFDENFKQINDTIQNLQEIIVNQNDAIMKAMAEQKVLTERLLYQEVNKKKLPSTFPIKDINGLNEINRSISEENREAYINTMKSLLKGRLPKTLTEIISINLCMDINLDGIHGKRRLKDFEVFFHTLTDACRTLGSQDVEKDIRNALKIIKKTCYSCAVH
ncbi:hypothetical protein FF38_13743 [Lucilia cuprina]|uniref:DUF4806 domain-containing protein n=1 Tax=Lucilia cuprina TaxID=7375 RepID=A0A0L0BSU8_LUCCU|nr:hypothetical protein FF38_13743 [Lucilia cuprina]